jgi:uncharacterized membrane protein YbhN (UPF0104 family)
MTKRHLLLVAKFLIAIAILALLFRFVNVGDMFARLQSAAPAYIIAAQVALVVQVTCASLRWIQILRLTGSDVKIGRSMGSFAAGSLVNAALPGGIAGDVMRIWATVRDGIGLGATTYSVILDRIVAMLGLGVLAALASGVRLATQSTADKGLETISLLLGGAAIVAAIALVSIAPIIDRLVVNASPALLRLGNLSRMAGSLRSPTGSLSLAAITLLTNFLLVVAAILLAWGLRVPLQPVDALIGVPLALLVAAVPVTPGGWGLRESAMAVFLTRFGIDAAAAITISVLLGFFSILATLPGAAIWFAWLLISGGRLRRLPEATTTAAQGTTDAEAASSAAGPPAKSVRRDPNS